MLSISIRIRWLISGLALFLVLFIAMHNVVLAQNRYTIDGDFDGCDYGKLYPLLEGGILECEEYIYFYEYSPDVITIGRRVIRIGDEEVDGYLHNGYVIQTQIDGDYEGCDFGKRYDLMNGLIFVCNDYDYDYDYYPDVKIFFIEDWPPIVTILGNRYEGTLYRQ